MTRYFTRKKEEVVYQYRQAAYGIIIKHDQVGVVKVRDMHMLAGGGLEANETPIEALHRECLEELGVKIEVIDFLGDFKEYDYSIRNQTHYEMHGYVYIVKLLDEKVQVSEEDHQLVWYEPQAIYGGMRLDYMNYCIGLLMMRGEDE